MFEIFKSMFKTTFKLCSALGAFIFLISCSSENTEEAEEVQSDYLNKFISYPIDMEAPKRKFSELIEKVHVVRVEETDESLIGNLYNIKEHDGLVTYPNTGDGLVYQFDKEGNYLGRLDRSGDGPEEYKDIFDHWIKGDTLKIFSNANSKIMSYNLDGDFLKSETLPFRANQVFESEDGYWLDLSYRPRGDSTNYEVIHLNSQMKSPTFYRPFEKISGFPVVTTVNPFRKVNGNLLYKKTLSDTVYLVKSDTIAPIFKFDFGENLLWADEEMRNDSQRAMSALSSAGKVWIINPIIGERFIYFNYNTSFEDNYVMFLDPIKNKLFNLDMRKGPEEKYGIMFNSWVGDREMLVGVNSLDVAPLIDEIGESKVTYGEGTTLEEIESSENPALMWVTFKDDL